MKTCILFLFLLLCLSENISAQEDDLVFKYLKEQVHQVKMSRVEWIDMTYQDGLIIGKEYRNGPLVERRFYYTEIGKIDSMKWSWEIGGEQYIVNKYYEYGQGGRLEKVKELLDADGEMFDLDLYRYDEAGRVDSILSWRNYSQSSFLQKKIIPLYLAYVKALSYNSIGRLAETEQIFGLQPTTRKVYTYDDEGQVRLVSEYHTTFHSRRIEVIKHTTGHFRPDLPIALDLYK